MIEDLEELIDMAAVLSACLTLFRMLNRDEIPDGELDQIQLCLKDLDVVGTRLTGVLVHAKTLDNQFAK